MYLFVPCDKKSHGTEISFPIRSNRLYREMRISCVHTNSIMFQLNNTYISAANIFVKPVINV